MDLGDPRARRVRPDKDATEDVADERRLTEAVGDQTSQEARDHDQNEIRGDPHARARRSTVGTTGTSS